MTTETITANVNPAAPTSPTLTRSVPLGKDSGKHFAVPLHELLPPEVVAIACAAATPKARLLRDLLLVGTSRIFVDVQAAAKTDAERLANCQKKLDAWGEGEMNVKGGGGGGETLEGEVKRLLVAAYMERTGESESRALLKFKGRGYDVLAAIAQAKAEAEALGLADDATDEQKAAHAKAVGEAATRHLEAAKAAWNAKAVASLKAKADARQKAEGFTVTDLLA